MIPSFEIHSTDNDGKLRFEGSVPRDLSGYDGCEYDVALTSAVLSATVKAYDIQPTRWSGFFAELAENWKGWTGEKTMESLEHHLKLTATADSLGHVSLVVQLRDVLPGSDWRAQGLLT